MSLTVLGIAMVAIAYSVAKMIASERQVRVAQIEIDLLQRRASERRNQLAAEMAAAERK